MPAFLSRRYVYYAGATNAHRCLFAIDLASADATPAQIEKHIAIIAREYGGLVVYATASLNALRRARLVASGVPFVVPGNQLYVPELAVDLREHYRARPQRSPEQLSPAAQAVLFYLVLFSNELRATKDLDLHVKCESWSGATSGVPCAAAGIGLNRRDAGRLS